jgi:tetratricopeptide (TPR) repeat protein
LRGRPWAALAAALATFAVTFALGAGPVRVAAAESAAFTREYQAGVDAFRLGRLDVARAHLEKARTLAPRLPGPSRFLAAVAHAQERWADCIEAARLALAQNPRSNERVDTRKLHDRCREAAGRPAYRGELGERAAIAVTTSIPGAAVRIGGLGYGATPVAPRPIEPGTLAVELAKPGFRPVRLEVAALPGIVTDVAVELAPEPAPAPTPPAPPARPAAPRAPAPAPREPRSRL